MKKCDCFRVEEKILGRRKSGTIATTPVYRCNGTRERDECTCGGDRRKCDFYSDVREKAILEDINGGHKMQWYVMLFDYNQGKTVPYNVFNNSHFSRDVAYVLANSNNSRKELSEVLDRAASYAFWGRCEYECIVSDWPPSGREEKISVYDQLRCNWDRFVDYVMSYKESKDG